MGATYAVLTGIQAYQQRGIGFVQFAQADAAAMKDLLVQDLGVPAENASNGDMIGLVARFRNEAIYGQDVAAARAVRAHLKLFDKNNDEIGSGYSSALWLGHRNDTFDLVPNGPAGSVLVCLGSKTKARVRWKTRASIDRLHDNDMELKDGYPSRAEVALLDSRDRLLLAPIVLEVTETAGELSVAPRQ